MRHSWVGCMLVAALWSPASAQGSAASEQYAEKLVHAVYFEGIPYGEARRIDAAGAVRLTEMLSDDSEKPHHAKILVALGMSQQPGTFEALVAFSEPAKSGEMDRSEFQAWRVFPTAMGHLASRDPRALRWLIEEAQNPRAPHQTYRQHDLAELRRRAAIHGLAVSGTHEAGTLLRSLRDPGQNRSAQPAGEEPHRRRLDAALALHERIAREGPIGIGSAEQTP